MPEKKNTTLKKLLMILGGIIILVIIISVLRGSSRTSSTSTGLVTSSGTGAPLVPGVAGTPSSTTAVSDETAILVQLLQEVSTLKLDNDVFLNPVFGALIDISSAIPSDQNPGRVNPFSPIGEDTISVDLGMMSDVLPTDTNALDTFLNQSTPTP